CSGSAPPPPVEHLAPATAPAVAAPVPPDAGAPLPIADKPVEETVAPPVFVLPATFDERMQLGRRLPRQGKIDDAVAAFEGASALAPVSERPYLELARLHLGEGKTKAARVDADQAIVLAPTSSAAWNTKGRVCFVEKQYDAAVYSFSK